MSASGRTAAGVSRGSRGAGRMRRWWRRQNRPLMLALAFSAALHLSAVTMFSIGIWFPAEQRVYHRFDIIDERSGLPLDASGSGGRLSSALFGGELETPSLQSLPSISLPKVDYRAMGERQLRRAQLDTLMRFESMERGEERDAWSQLETGVETLRSRFTGLNPFSTSAAEEEQPDDALVKLSEPAPGFEIYMDWLTGDRTRDALFAGSLDALTTANPDDLRSPLSFIVEVDASGRVVSVMPPLTPTASIVDALTEQLARYRFAPAPDGGGRTQHGTLVISRVEEDL